MRLLLDTQILVWLVTGDDRLKQAWRDAITSPDNDLFVSAVIAVEYTELQLRHRIPVDERIAELADRFDLVIEEFPGNGWERIEHLPQVHRDPVDRMLVVHAQMGDFTLLTADAKIRQYPVNCL